MPHLAGVPFPYASATLADEWVTTSGQPRSAAGRALPPGRSPGCEDDRETMVGGAGLRMDRTPARATSATGSGGASGARRGRRGVPGGWCGGRWPISTSTGSRRAWPPTTPARSRCCGVSGSARSATACRLLRGTRRRVSGADRFEATRADLFERVARDRSHPHAGSRTPAGLPLLLVAACALIDSDGRILLARRPEGKTMAGLWEFPGGKLHPGETPEAALIRELREELGHRRRQQLPRPVRLRQPRLRRRSTC